MEEEYIARRGVNAGKPKGKLKRTSPNGLDYAMNLLHTKQQALDWRHAASRESGMPLSIWIRKTLDEAARE